MSNISSLFCAGFISIFSLLSLKANAEKLVCTATYEDRNYQTVTNGSQTFGKCPEGAGHCTITTTIDDNGVVDVTVGQMVVNPAPYSQGTNDPQVINARVAAAALSPQGALLK